MAVNGFLVNNEVQKYNYESLENYNTPDFNTSSTYQVGDYVMYQGKLYKCTTAITTSGTWDSTKWSLAILSDDVADLKNLIYQIDTMDSSPTHNYFIYSVNHRGYSSSAPENTLPAFILSKKNGFDYVETDVEFTQDGVAILLHDSTINRTARNADGTIISSPIDIGNITYQQALEYDFGIWKGASYAGTKIPTFAQFILLCKQLCIHPFIELKDTAGGSYWTDARIKTVADEINAVGMAENVSFISFSQSALSKMSVHFPKARLGLGMEGGYSIGRIANLITQAQSLRTSENTVIVSLAYDRVTSEMYEQLVTAGILPFLWTVNSESVALNLNPSVCGVLSDYINAGKVIFENILNSDGTVSFTVTRSLNYCSSNNDSSSVKAGSSYSATITAASGYTLEGATVSITMGGADITSTAYSNGLISIPTVTGDIVISVTAVEYTPSETYTVTNTLTNCTSNNAATNTYEGSSYSATITAASGYTLEGATVSITMGGADITSTAYSNGLISIPTVTGDIVISVSAVLAGPVNPYEYGEIASIAVNMYEANPSGSPTNRARVKKEYLQAIPSGATSVNVTISSAGMGGGKYKIGWAFYTNRPNQIQSTVQGWFSTGTTFTASIPSDAVYFMLYYASVSNSTVIDLDEVIQGYVNHSIIFNNQPTIDYAKELAAIAGVFP